MFSVDSWSSGNNWGLWWWSLVFGLYLRSPWSSSTHATIFPSQPGTTAPSWNTCKHPEFTHLRHSHLYCMMQREKSLHDGCYQILWNGNKSPHSVLKCGARAAIISISYSIAAVLHWPAEGDFTRMPTSSFTVPNSGSRALKWYRKLPCRSTAALKSRSVTSPSL